jgi:hypothetical protein
LQKFEVLEVGTNPIVFLISTLATGDTLFFLPYPVSTYFTIFILTPNLYHTLFQSYHMDVRNQHRHFANLQAHWRGNALSDARYNLQRAAEAAKNGNRVLSHGYMQEYHWDIFWANRRKKIMENERGKV